MTMPAPPPSFRRPLAALAALTVAALVIVPTAASAHIRVHADNAESGSFSQLTFRVPTESDTASTVKVQVDLPPDKPLLYVSTKPVPGWTARTVEAVLPQPVESYGTTVTRAVRTITWSADSPASAIAPGEYQEFSISAGPLPAPGDLPLPATQTYSDGEVVAWNETQTTPGAEPEHPAPVLVVTADGQPDAATPAATPAGRVDAVARGLGIAGLAVASAGTVVAALALARSRGRSRA